MKERLVKKSKYIGNSTKIQQQINLPRISNSTFTVSLSGGFPLSTTFTIKLYPLTCSLSNFLVNVITPVFASILNGSEFADLLELDCSSLLSSCRLFSYELDSIDLVDATLLLKIENVRRAFSALSSSLASTMRERKR